MSTQQIPVGYDFIFAKLHGMWANAAQNQQLYDLAKSATEENFLHQLGDYGLANVTQNTFRQKVQERQFVLLHKVRQYVIPSISRHLEAKIENIADENLKVLFNYHFFPDQDNNIEDLLIDIPNRDYKKKAIFEAKTAEEFLNALPPCVDSAAVRQIVLQLEKDHDIMRAEAALDQLAYQYELKTAHELPFSLRRAATSLVQFEIDTTNCLMLLRNANNYHFPLQQLQFFWIHGGTKLASKDLKIYHKIESVSELIHALPLFFQELLQPYAEQDLYHCEHVLWNRMYNETLKLFRNFNKPILSIIAFPYLLHFETINLNRIFEGIRFALPDDEIINMMIGKEEKSHTRS